MLSTLLFRTLSLIIAMLADVPVHSSERDATMGCLLSTARIGWRLLTANCFRRLPLQNTNSRYELQQQQKQQHHQRHTNSQCRRALYTAIPAALSLHEFQHSIFLIENENRTGLDFRLHRPEWRRHVWAGELSPTQICQPYRETYWSIIRR